jgi:hypothetical protein
MSNIRPTDAETVDGQDAAEIGRSDSEIQEKSVIHSEAFAPGFGG